MTPEELAALMNTATLPGEWTVLALSVLAAHGGRYPDHWYDTVIASGLYDRVRDRWGDTGPAMTATPDTAPPEERPYTHEGCPGTIRMTKTHGHPDSTALDARCDLCGHRWHKDRWDRPWNRGPRPEPPRPPEDTP